LKECFLKFPEGRHEGLGYKPSAINTEIALSVRYSFDKILPSWEIIIAYTFTLRKRATLNGKEPAIIPSPPEGEGKGEGDHLCLYYYETVNIS
jgi:hypothetical protein